MDDITPEQIIAIAFGCFAGLSGLGVLLFWWTSPRAFAIFFGCKLKSAPKITPSGRREKPKSKVSSLTNKLEIEYNPIMILTDPKVEPAPARPTVMTPLRVYRPASARKKEFTVAPARTPK